MHLNNQWLATLCDENGKSFHQVSAAVLDFLLMPKPQGPSIGEQYIPDDAPANDEKYVGTEIIADFLGISVRTLRDWCVNNRVTYYRPNPFGGNFLFKLSEIKADMEKIKVRSKWKS